MNHRLSGYPLRVCVCLVGNPTFIYGVVVRQRIVIVEGGCLYIERETLLKEQMIYEKDSINHSLKLYVFSPQAGVFVHKTRR